jgi:excisionase family DNA binding protein
VPATKRPNRASRRHPETNGDGALLVSKTVACERLGCSRWTIRRLIASGELAVVKVAGHESIAVAELENCIERNTRRAKA